MNNTTSASNARKSIIDGRTLAVAAVSIVIVCASVAALFLFCRPLALSLIAGGANFFPSPNVDCKDETTARQLAADFVHRNGLDSRSPVLWGINACGYKENCYKIFSSAQQAPVEDKPQSVTVNKDDAGTKFWVVYFPGTTGAKGRSVMVPQKGAVQLWYEW